VIRAEQSGADLVAQRVKKIVEEATSRIGMRNREVKVTATYSTLTFASKAQSGTLAAEMVQPIEDNTSEMGEEQA
jgi:hypothetical protein